MRISEKYSILLVTKIYLFLYKYEIYKFYFLNIIIYHSNNLYSCENMWLNLYFSILTCIKQNRFFFKEHISLWGTNADFNIEILQHFHCKILRMITNAPILPYITDNRLRHDLTLTDRIGVVSSERVKGHHIHFP